MIARSLSAVGLLAALGLLACLAKPPPVVKQRTFEVSPGLLERVVVAPFYPTPRLARSVTPAGISASTAAELVTRFFTEALERAYYQVIPATDLVIAFEGQGQPVPRLDPQAVARLAHRKFGATGIVLGEVMRYRERSGGGAGSETPASVAFGVTFYSAPDGRRVWTGRFEETQQSLTANVLRARQYPGRGTRWLSAAEFASWGADRLVAALPASMR